MKLRSDTAILLILAAVLCVYLLASQTIQNARAQRLGPLCAKHGWVLIDNNMGGPAKCLDPKTSLMYLPIEVLNER